MRRAIFYSLLLIAVTTHFAFAAVMSAQAASKMDPRLIAVHKDPAVHARAMGKTINLTGSSVDQMLIPVLVKTTASKTELESTGAIVGSRSGDIVTARVTLQDLESLALLENVEAIEASYKLYNCMDVSVPECGGSAVHNQLGYDGQGVVVGLLDTGIDPYHPDFLDSSNRARVQYIWDQWSQQGPAPSGYSYGREWTKAQIDANQCTMNDPGAHGSHCAGTTSGDGSASSAGYVGMAPKSDIIMVANLGEDLFTYGYSIPWYSNPGGSVGSIDGLNYMHGKAQQLGKPLVVSWSQGVTMGPHDGTTLFEQGVSNFITSKNVPVVIAAGNDQQQAWHAKGTVTTGSPLTVNMTTGTPGYDQLTGLVTYEIWYKSGDQMNLTVVDPWGGATQEFGPNETQWPGWIVSTGDTVWVYSTSNHPVNNKGYFLVMYQNWNMGVNQGTWQVRLSAANSLPQGGQVDLWAERNQYSVHFLDHVSLENIVGMPGTTTEAITVAAYNTKLQWTGYDGNQWSIQEILGDIAGFSSNGPRADGYQKPDISAPGQIIASVMSSGAAQEYMQNQPGIVAPDGVHLLFQGTSMATPHVAGTIALMLQKNPNLSYTQIKDYLKQTARHDQFTGQGWDKAFGWGKLDALAAVNAVGGGGGETVELIYDDGTPYSGYYWPGNGQGSGVTMTPPQYPATINTLRYYINSLDGAGTGGNGSFYARVYDTVTGNQISNQVTATPTGTGWFDVDISGQGVEVNAEFIVGMFYDGVNTPSYGYDQVDNGRAWDFDGTNWGSWTETYFMRSIVTTGLSVEEDLELAGFSASANEDGIVLLWNPRFDWETTGFNLYRNKNESTSGWTQINDATVQTTEYVDQSVLPGETYYYWVEAVAPSGVGTIFGPAEVTAQGKPNTVVLRQPHPTPTTASASLSFFIPQEGDASLALYDLAGRKVVSIASMSENAGWHELNWTVPTTVSSGRYICRLAFRNNDMSLQTSKPFVFVK